MVLGNTTSQVIQKSLSESNQGHIPRVASELIDGKSEVIAVIVPVLGSPALHEAHANGAHAGELVHGLKALIHRLGQ